MDKNKVEFGISNLHVGTYDVNPSTGAVTMGEGIILPGAVSLSLEPEGDSNSFYADDMIFHSDYQDNGFSGTLKVARFTDDFKKKFLGYVETKDGGLASVKGAVKPALWVSFEAKGDKEKRRVLLYNVTLGGISREYETTSDKKEPATESSKITVIGDNATGLTQVVYNPSDTGYANVFTTPAKPELKG
jgi:phi13 family phage major tail protein|nr:MAG TPA: tail tube protein [Caudoviricetes sp.]